jgi:hypothetical protein
MTTPEQTPDTDQDVQELTDENLEGVSGGTRVPITAISDLTGVDLSNGGSQGLYAYLDLTNGAGGHG